MTTVIEAVNQRIPQQVHLLHGYAQRKTMAGNTRKNRVKASHAWKQYEIMVPLGLHTGDYYPTWMQKQTMLIEITNLITYDNEVKIPLYGLMIKVQISIFYFLLSNALDHKHKLFLLF
ncbi:hypothetical protein TNIN_53631 [Trichonephila inaurata madagascariensis]|uniref:Uncharacterized protein n=1 Tax=Trichonephila inaurata madagascariensis TaxID=2747483 RepID=A0A8X6YZ71_9ARAC|nr:hypothetical protein TNIN_53631 [Trichonephila inaurata madagascariensis]